MAGMRVTFPSSFFGMIGFSISGQLCSSSLDFPSLKGAGGIHLYCSGLKLTVNIRIGTLAYSKIRYMLSSMDWVTR